MCLLIIYYEVKQSVAMSALPTGGGSGACCVTSYLELQSVSARLRCDTPTSTTEYQGNAITTINTLIIFHIYYLAASLPTSAWPWRTWSASCSPLPCSPRHRHCWHVQDFQALNLVNNVETILTTASSPGYCSESFPGQSCNVVCDFGRNNVPLCQVT